MNHAAPVRGVHGFSNVGAEEEIGAQRCRRIPARLVGDMTVERHAVDELHDEIQQSVVADPAVIASLFVGDLLRDKLAQPAENARLCLVHLIDGDAECRRGVGSAATFDVVALIRRTIVHGELRVDRVHRNAHVILAPLGLPEVLPQVLGCRVNRFGSGGIVRAPGRIETKA